MSVDIREEVHPPLPDGGSTVAEDHRYRLLQADGCGLAFAHRLCDTLLGPFRFIGKNELRQGRWRLDTNAAVTEIAPITLEEWQGGRVMQVNVLLVGKHKLDVAKGIAGPESM